MTIISFTARAGSTDSTRGHPATRRALGMLRAKLRARAEERRRRRDYNAMLDLDDAILRDIGVTRGEIHWAANLPLSVDSRQAIDESRHARSPAA